MLTNVSPEQIETALQKVPVDDRECFLLNRSLCWEPERIARLRGSTAQQVHQSITRTLLSIRAQLLTSGPG